MPFTAIRVHVHKHKLIHPSTQNNVSSKYILPDNRSVWPQKSSLGNWKLNLMKLRP